jgi:hypothetical protein
MRWRSLALAVTAGLGATLVIGTAASAAPVTCATGIRKCAFVTAIDPGSHLVFHNQPDYAHGVIRNSPALVNGAEVFLDCWTNGAFDADGGLDPYWFWATPGNGTRPAIGWINDFYVTTGAKAQWVQTIRHC